MVIGLAGERLGAYVAQALAITYASCQVTKLPRILMTFMLVPWAKAALDHTTNGQQIFIILLGGGIFTVFSVICALCASCIV